MVAINMKTDVEENIKFSTENFKTNRFVYCEATNNVAYQSLWIVKSNVENAVNVLRSR